LARKLRNIKLYLFLLILICNVNLNSQTSINDTNWIFNKNFDDTLLSIPFKFIEKGKNISFTSYYFQIKELSNYKQYSQSSEITPYQESFFKALYNNRDSNLNYKREYIGAVDKYQIIKFEKSGDRQVFIYNDNKFEDIFWGESGIWIALSNENGKNWEYYFTGIEEKTPFFLKWYSKLPLILDDDKIQIESAILEQTKAASHPGPPASYKVLKDGISIIFDLKKIIKDSDGDGLTDLVEQKFMTNPYSKDTDGDSIPDNLDLNPRYNIPKTEKTLIYEAILNEDSVISEEGCNIPASIKTHKAIATDSTETIMIITNDSIILSVQPTKYRVIIVTEEEYENRYKADSFYTGSYRMHLSAFKKNKKEKDTYIVTQSFNTWGQEFIIKKTKKGWNIKRGMSWIS
jgi:hypothetical protein